MIRSVTSMLTSTARVLAPKIYPGIAETRNAAISQVAKRFLSQGREAETWNNRTTGWSSLGTREPVPTHYQGANQGARQENLDTEPEITSLSDFVDSRQGLQNQELAEID